MLQVFFLILYLHFIDEEMKVQRSDLTCLKYSISKWYNLGFEPRTVCLQSLCSHIRIWELFFFLTETMLSLSNDS